LAAVSGGREKKNIVLRMVCGWLSMEIEKRLKSIATQPD